MFNNALHDYLSGLTSCRDIPCLSVSLVYKSKILFSHSYGFINECNCDSISNLKFDIASLTKIFSGICFMKLVESGYISLSDHVCDIFPEFNKIKPIEKNGKLIDYCDASRITWYHVLTHTTGMGWTREKTRPSLPNLDKGLDDIFNLPFAYKPGNHVVYSDIPIILMGKAMEIITESKLDDLVSDMICVPLGLENTGYLRRSLIKPDTSNIVPTEFDEVFRKRRIWGEVHDENAFLLDGVSAHAGIFSTVEDLSKLAIAYNNCLKEDGLLKRSTVMNMIQQHVEENGDRRGLIWQLSGHLENSYTRFLSSNAYGHSGFTGCFLWTDPDREFSIVLLSNDIYNGRENRKLLKHRSEIMRLAVQCL